MAALHRHLTRALSTLLVLLGMAVAVSALARGGGLLSVGVVVGAALALLGVGRLLLARGAAPRARA